MNYGQFPRQERSVATYRFEFVNRLRTLCPLETPLRDLLLLQEGLGVSVAYQSTRRICESIALEIGTFAHDISLGNIWRRRRIRLEPWIRLLR